MNLMISVVIATHNSERLLVPTLAALVPGALAGLVSEVIIADADSTDGTPKIAEEAGCRFLTATQKGAGLQEAAKAARASWLLFLAPGTVPDAIWIDAASRFMEAAEIKGATKAQAAVFRRATPAGSRLPILREAVTFIGSALGALPDPGQGLLIAKALYNELGGHSDKRVDPERTFLRRIGRRRIATLRCGAMALKEG
jgi:glycosyltransferase involved in cell wall biosynthesis